MGDTTRDQKLHEVLQQTFGFSSFRPGQLEAVTTLLGSGRLLSIQPTGYGKSLLYQLPAVLLEGMTVVISPLLALMRDQIRHLTQRYNISAGAINSDQSDEDNALVWSAARSGNLRILFIAPEQLNHVDRVASLLDLSVSLVVVDEAHCISSWGHDFRPSYRQIAHYIRDVQTRQPGIRILGLTATANAVTEHDIMQQLSADGREMTVMRSSMSRPNIGLEVLLAPSIEKKLVACADIVGRIEGSGLIYCATRDHTVLVAEHLQRMGIPAQAYHAGLAPEYKSTLQTAFIHDEHKVIAATNALGMGIDKPNVRFVIHFDLPGSITAYYQEVGRAGRDGLPAHGILLYNPADRKIQEHFIRSAQPTLEDFDVLLRAVEDSTQALGLMALQRLTGLHPTRCNVVIAEFVEQGFLVKRSVNGKQVYVRTDKIGVPELTRYERQKKVKDAELASMIHYAKQNDSCRMALLREALGDSETESCSCCSICGDYPIALDATSPQLTETETWLQSRPIPIEGFKRVNMLEGIAIFDATHRSRHVVEFMKGRAVPSDSVIGVSDEIWEILVKHLKFIKGVIKPCTVFAVPSNTWTSRDKVAEAIAGYLDLACCLDALWWQEMPPRRQGELCNNEQRRHNVKGKIVCDGSRGEHGRPILLVDDYTGSRATLSEACRAIRSAKITNPIYPLTIASVKWRQGQPGLV